MQVYCVLTPKVTHLTVKCLVSIFSSTSGCDRAGRGVEGLSEGSRAGVRLSTCRGAQVGSATDTLASHEAKCHVHQRH